MAAALRTLEEIWEAGSLAGAAMPPMSQAKADRISFIKGDLRSQDLRGITTNTVMLAGHSGGADAAPVAAQILEAYKAGRL